MLVDLSQIDLEQFEKILWYIKSGTESSATLECGGARLGSRGFYIQPTVFSNVQVIARDGQIAECRQLKYNNVFEHSC